MLFAALRTIGSHLSSCGRLRTFASKASGLLQPAEPCHNGIMGLSASKAPNTGRMYHITHYDECNPDLEDCYEADLLVTAYDARWFGGDVTTVSRGQTGQVFSQPALNTSSTSTIDDATQASPVFGDDDELLKPNGVVCALTESVRRPSKSPPLLDSDVPSLLDCLDPPKVVFDPMDKYRRKKHCDWFVTNDPIWIAYAGTTCYAHPRYLKETEKYEQRLRVLDGPAPPAWWLKADHPANRVAEVPPASQDLSTENCGVPATTSAAGTSASASDSGGPTQHGNPSNTITSTPIMRSLSDPSSSSSAAARAPLPSPTEEIEHRLLPSGAQQDALTNGTVADPGAEAAAREHQHVLQGQNAHGAQG